MSDQTILSLANLIVNGVQVMFLAYLSARFTPAMRPPKE